MEKKINYSVLMSVYYKEKPEWLSQSIESMLNQTIRTNDFVIVKDGPLTQELNEVINKYLEMYPSLFNIVNLKKNLGLGLALNLGIKKCKNEWIARMDSDDISSPKRCEKQIQEIMKDNDLDIIGTNHIEFKDDVNNKNEYLYKKLPSFDEEIKKYAKRRNPFSHSSVMLRKSKVLESGNYRHYHLVEDYDLWVRMIENKAKCQNINEYLSYVRVDSQLYKRRGGIKYLKSILKFKSELYKKGFYSKKDYLISASSHIFVCLIPNFARRIIYERVLRKK